MHQRKTLTTGCTIAILATALLATPVFAQSATLASQVATDEARLIDLFKKLIAAAAKARELRLSGMTLYGGVGG